MSKFLTQLWLILFLKCVFLNVFGRDWMYQTNDDSDLPIGIAIKNKQAHLMRALLFDRKEEFANMQDRQIDIENLFTKSKRKEALNFRLLDRVLSNKEYLNLVIEWVIELVNSIVKPYLETVIEDNNNNNKYSVSSPIGNNESSDSKFNYNDNATSLAAGVNIRSSSLKASLALNEDNDISDNEEKLDTTGLSINIDVTSANSLGATAESESMEYTVKYLNVAINSSKMKNYVQTDRTKAHQIAALRSIIECFNHKNIEYFGLESRVQATTADNATNSNFSKRGLFGKYLNIIPPDAQVTLRAVTPGPGINEEDDSRDVQHLDLFSVCQSRHELYVYEFVETYCGLKTKNNERNVIINKYKTEREKAIKKFDQESKTTEYERRLEMLQKRADYNKFSTANNDFTSISGISGLDRSKSSKKHENMELAKERKTRNSRKRFSNIYTTAHASWANMGLGNAPEYENMEYERGNIFADDFSFYASDIDSTHGDSVNRPVAIGDDFKHSAAGFDDELSMSSKMPNVDENGTDNETGKILIGNNVELMAMRSYNEPKDDTNWMERTYAFVVESLSTADLITDIIIVQQLYCDATFLNSSFCPSNDSNTSAMDERESTDAALQWFTIATITFMMAPYLVSYSVLGSVGLYIIRDRQQKKKRNNTLFNIACLTMMTPVNFIYFILIDLVFMAYVIITFIAYIFSCCSSKRDLKHWIDDNIFKTIFHMNRMQITGVCFFFFLFDCFCF